MSIKDKLAELGLSLPTAAAPVAAYVPAVKSGNLVFTAGQLPLANGEMFGELSLFDPGPRTSTATAVTDAKLLSLGQEKLIPWLATNPNVSLQLLARLAQRLRRTNEAVGDLVFSDVPGRVASQGINFS